jgi:hypothetical protein
MKKIILLLTALTLTTFLYSCSTSGIVSYESGSMISRESGTYYLTKPIQAKEQSISLHNGIIIINTYYDSTFYSTMGTYTTSLTTDSIYATITLEFITNTLSNTVDTVERCWYANYKVCGDTLIKSNPITGYQYWVK